VPAWHSKLSMESLAPMHSPMPCRLIKDRDVDPRPGRAKVPATVILPPGKVGLQGEELGTGSPPLSMECQQCVVDFNRAR
jgi:hypothetical protein